MTALRDGLNSLDMSIFQQSNEFLNGQRKEEVVAMERI